MLNKKQNNVTEKDKDTQQLIACFREVLHDNMSTATWKSFCCDSRNCESDIYIVFLTYVYTQTFKCYISFTVGLI